ncbi:hypothetical protein HPSA_04015 [Helicobacter pylori SouthAfrica7]|uniref:Uncharacterized protein n=1 Tax=Helicobacter pylori (strain SouthAfrica7) TaxID=907239 RepID=E8QS31_HELPW|nr:hypothetical protein HPSA_04015 [Helicobacter pylori SouthAfrica7]
MSEFKKIKKYFLLYLKECEFLDIGKTCIQLNGYEKSA